MKIPLLAITLLSASLTACVTPSALPTCAPFLEPTVIDGRYKSQLDVVNDPESTTRNLIDFGGSAEDALQRANADKASCKKLTENTR